METITITKEAYDATLAALYGAREHIGKTDNIQRAIDLLTAANGAEVVYEPYPGAFDSILGKAQE